MHIYLPIAGISASTLGLLGVGGGIGFLSGLLGVGGGFLLTPMLILFGIPPAVAVATGASQLVGTSVSGVLAHLRRGNVDLRMGLVLLAGGVAGSSAGVLLFTLLRSMGQLELAINLCYVVLLGTMGLMMSAESVRSILGSRRGKPRRGKLHQHWWVHGLPFKMRFRRSRLYISALLPLGIGFGVGVLSAIMGVGGGFIIVPAMIYLLGMPTSVVVGTSLFQVVFVAANTAFLQATFNQAVDIVLALVLLAGGVVGAQLGARWTSRVPGEWLRALLAVLVLGLGIKLTVDLLQTPDDPWAVRIEQRL
ncbi:MAG: sulfite exporter TauE/SafE family protein [Acetobacterales bacterium]